MRELHGLQTVIATDQSTLRKYAVAIEYFLHEPQSQADGHASGSSAPARGPNRLGSFILTVGSDAAWWSASVQGPALQQLVTKFAPPQEPHLGKASALAFDPEYLTQAQCIEFRDRLRTIFHHQAIMIGVQPSTSTSPRDWTSINLLLDPENDYVHLTLSRLDDRQALVRTASIVLSNTPYAPPPLSPNPAELAPHIERGDVKMSLERDQLLRKLEETQQALREERHKYRSLLAAPSASNARTTRGRPVVGLRPRITGSASQRSIQLPSSSASSESRRGIERSSSGSGPQAPSSDDFPPVGGDTQTQASQRLTSLVNPTRVRRADPRENDGFVGDDD
uniref:Uncharacterized protein n=2 Tax=Kalmanozyma brasiliensis (strain GHG001) TaxID=1365824 RepID=V5EYG2_KALBG